MPIAARRSAQIENRSAHTGLPHESGALESISTLMSYERNEEIYGEGESAEYLYKVVSGAVRTFLILDDGRRQVGAFYMPGDFFGLEVGDEHSSSCEAIGSARIMMCKRSAVLALANRDTNVAHQLWEITAAELSRAQNHIVLLIKSAQERVGSFLLELASRARKSAEIDLPMSRQDIADYLGLTIETVSRTLTQFESGGLIALPSARHVVLRNCSALEQFNG
jgi:CRP/FNR family nitrogen fixation transcriptional regulator